MDIVVDFLIIPILVFGPLALIVWAFITRGRVWKKVGAVHLQKRDREDEYNIPKWVLRWIRSNQAKLQESTHTGSHGVGLVLRGKYFEYLLDPASQSGEEVSVSRRRRKYAGRR